MRKKKRYTLNPDGIDVRELAKEYAAVIGFMQRHGVAIIEVHYEGSGGEKRMEDPVLFQSEGIPCLLSKWESYKPLYQYTIKSVTDSLIAMNGIDYWDGIGGTGCVMMGVDGEVSIDGEKYIKTTEQYFHDFNVTTELAKLVLQGVGTQ